MKKVSLEFDSDITKDSNNFKSLPVKNYNSAMSNYNNNSKYNSRFPVN